MDYKLRFIACWPPEGVGYVKDGQFHTLEKFAADPRYAFEVDPAFMLEEPDCLLHSHCTGVEVLTGDPRSPSSEDLKGQIATAIEWGICVTDGEVCEDPLYWGNPKNRPPLLDREFIFNIQDCYALVQDWFYQERGIELPNGHRTPHWNEEGEDHLTERFQKWGFEKVDIRAIELGDVLFYRIRSVVPNHLGIYLGNGEVLSHFYGRISCVESIGKWASHIEFAARYSK